MLRLRIAAALVAGGLGAATLHGQDALVVAPQAYKLVLDNEWVRVVRVRYAPQERLPLHGHPTLPTAYIYLNDGGPVTFRHDYGTVVRPETKAGGFRLSGAISEVHEVENSSSLPSDFLQLQFKTEPARPPTLRGRFAPESFPAGESVERVVFDDKQVRIRRLWVTAGQKLTLAPTGKEPELLVAFRKARLSVLSGEAPTALDLEVGDVHWQPGGEASVLVNTGDAPVELLAFGLKAPPVKPG